MIICDMGKETLTIHPIFNLIPALAKPIRDDRGERLCTISDIQLPFGNSFGNSFGRVLSRLNQLA